MQSSYDLDVKRLANVFFVQKGLIITVVVVVFALAVYLATSLPNMYRSSTLILITPPKLPASYINSPVAWSIEQRVRTISQDILSRSRLGKIVEEFDLYPLLSSMDARVEKLRKNMVIDVRRSDAFALSFEHRSPQQTQQVAARLAALFMDENQQLREEQSSGTATFVSDEADRLRKLLEEQESEVNLYKAQHRFDLPEQLDANLRTLEQMRSELQGNTVRLSSLQERKGSLDKQLAEGKFILPEAGAESQENVPVWRQLEVRREQLEDLRVRYSEKHPDIVRLRQEIKSLEAQTKAQQPQTKGSAPVVRNPVQQILLKQVADLSSEINSLQSANERLRGQIAAYQTRVDNAPIRAIELTKISRAYEVTLRTYQDMQKKTLETQLSESMDKKEKGEQFRIIDAANLPQQPVGPDRFRILLVGFIMALAGGFGLAFLRENLDTSLKRGDELRDHTDLPLLATIPATNTRGSILEQRRAQRMLVLASGMILIVGVVSIHLFGTLYY